MNYTQIQSEIASWLNRDDLTEKIPTFIELVEARLNRMMRVRQMETAMASTAIASNIITPDADTLEPKVLWRPGFEQLPLKASPLEMVIANGTTGVPTMYAWNGTDLYFDGTGNIQGVLYEKIPPIATNTTNWVGDSYYGLYVFGALAEAALFIGDDPTAWLARFDQIANEMRVNDQRMHGPLAVKAR